MQRDIDSFLLDRVFQPAVDAVADWLSCFGLARVSLCAAILLQTVILAWGLNQNYDFTQTAILVLGTLAEYFAAQMVFGQIKRMERRARPGMMNIGRVIYRPLRLLWFAFAVGAAAIWLGSAFRVSDFLSFAVGFCWMLTVYFMCCALMPPRIRSYNTKRMAAFAGAS